MDFAEWSILFVWCPAGFKLPRTKQRSEERRKKGEKRGKNGKSDATHFSYFAFSLLRGRKVTKKIGLQDLQKRQE